MISALLPYQVRWVQDRSRVKVIEKSRRIGITWATAVDCVLDASDGTCDTWYIAYSEDAASEFVKDAREWADKLGMTESMGEVEHLEVDDQGDDIPVPDTPLALPKKGIQTYRLTFTSGKRITALSSRPRNLRGKQGRVIIDEAAFHDDLPGLLKAAMSLLIWGKGSRVEIISTHNGDDSAFNTLVEEIRAGKHPTYALHSVDFDQALAEGFYQRICLVNALEWTPEGQVEWRDQIIAEHGVDADEELFLRPNKPGSGGWFPRSRLHLIDSVRDISFRPPEVTRAVRAWDLAATKAGPSNPDPDWSRGVRVLELSDGNFLIDDMISLRDGPGPVQALMVDTAKEDGSYVEVATFQDPGAAGKADISAKGQALTGHIFHTPRAAKSKEDFAKPWANLALQGRIYVLKRVWTEDYLRELERFPGGRHDDAVDATSCAFEVLIGGGGYSANWAKAWEI